MNRKSFIIHLDSLAILDDLTVEQRGELFYAIYKYQSGEELKLDTLMKIAFLPFKNQFQRDEEKYQRIVNRNRNNGLKGGRPKNPKNPVGYLETQRNPKKPKKADNDNNSDNESDNKSENAKPPEKVFSEDVYKLASQFKKTLDKKLWPKNSAAERWLDVLDKCMRIDGYSYAEISEIIEVFRADAFWGANFLSPLKLRKLNNDGVKYIDYFWQKLESKQESGKTDEQIAIEKHNKRVLNMWNVKEG